MKQPASKLRGGFLDPCSVFHMPDYLRTHLAKTTQASRRRARLMFLVVVGAQQESKLCLLEDELLNTRCIPSKTEQCSW